MARQSNRKDIHQVITDQIVAMMEEGVGTLSLPWQRGGACSTRPTNSITKKPYRGINVLSLWANSLRNDFTSGVWATYRQWQSIDAQVRKGEQGAAIVFYKPVIKKTTNGEPDEQYLLARGSTVFAAEQVDGYIPAVPKDNEVKTDRSLDAFVTSTGAVIEHHGDMACYSPKRDIITMPAQVRFVATDDGDATEGYYAVLLHELTHWTGHKSRCDRSAIRSYAFEELVAELGAAFLCADLRVGTTVRDDHAGYLASWLSELKNDKKAIFRAAGLASRAADFLHGLQLTTKQGDY